MGRLILRLLTVAGIGLVALVALVLLAITIGIPVHADWLGLRAPLAALASSRLDREVHLEGDLFLVPTWAFTLEAGGLRIDNPTGFTTPHFARMERARLRVRLLPLLRRRLQVAEISADGVELWFERRADGAVNWALGDPAAREPDAEEPAPERDFDPSALLLDSAEIETLVLRDLSVVTLDAVEGREGRSGLEELRASLATDKPLTLRLRGSLLEQPFDASLEGGDPNRLVTGEAAWPLALGFEIAGTRLEVRAQVDERRWTLEDATAVFVESAGSPLAGLEGRRLGEVEFSVEGERLDSLDGLLDVALPPFGPYRVAGRLQAFGAGRHEADLELSIGSSSLTGQLALELERQPPRAELRLEAPSVQLDDFAWQGWSPVTGAAPEEEATDETAPAALLSPAALSLLDGHLAVRVQQVRSGRDRLGHGLLDVELRGGRLRIAPLRVEVPGGGVEIRGGVAPRGRGVEGDIAARAERFDYGLLARRADPETDMAGFLALDVALRSRGPSLEALMANASGHLDFALFPENLEAGILDLWAVNLVTAVLPLVDRGKDSRVHCVVGLFDLQEGVMTEDTLFMDTSRMSVSGKARIDFRSEEIEVQLAPTPKRPEFFSAATPIRVEGHFDDFGLGVEPEDVLGSVIRFVTSVVHVPLRRLFQPREDPDELATCMAAIERRERGRS